MLLSKQSSNFGLDSLCVYKSLKVPQNCSSSVEVENNQHGATKCVTHTDPWEVVVPSKQETGIES